MPALADTLPSRPERACGGRWPRRLLVAQSMSATRLSAVVQDGGALSLTGHTGTG